MKKILFLIPTLLLSVACTPSVNLPAASLMPAQRSLATQTRTSAQASAQSQVALGGAMSADTQDDAQMSEAEQMAAYAYLNEMANAQAAYNYASAGNSGYAQAGYSSSSSSSEADPWAGTCGPNADYNEQLVCSGVPASMLPR